MEQIFQEIVNFFAKLKLKISIFMMHINSEKFPVDSIIKLRKPFLKYYNFQAKTFGFWKFSMKDLLFFSKGGTPF